MKQTGKLIPAIFIILTCSCEKISSERSIKVKKYCDVELFNSDYSVSTPYLFRKSYDASGRVNEIDAYFWGVAQTPLHFRASIRYKGLIVQFMDADKPQDTLMTLWLNSKGRPVKAVEYIAMYKGRGGPFQNIQYPIKYEFIYKDDKLWISNSDFTDFVFKDTCKYDALGNILSTGGNHYVYDHTREANQHFYMDLRELNAFLTGFNLLQYLQYFPELTSPPNVRTRHHVGLAITPIEYYRWLFRHEFDNDRNLVKYNLAVDTSFVPDIRTFTITWRCKKCDQEQR